MNFSQLPPQKKRVLAIGLVAFIVLLFVSFLLSLLEDDTQPQPQNAASQGQSQESLQLNRPQVPTSQRFDFDQGGQNQGAGLEQLLNNDQNIGVNHDPFANMNGQGTEAPSYGPAPLPTPEEEQNSLGRVEEELSMPAQKEHTLYCDEYSTAQEAESQKAMLAFQGISASVVQSGATYRLKIGPYSSNESAKKAFNDLGTKGLVKKCSLIAN